MKAIIHIGLEKTGSTSIQHYLASHRALLNKHGLHYSLAAGELNSFLLREAAIPPRAQSVTRTETGIHGNIEKIQLMQQQFNTHFEQEMLALDNDTTVIFSDEGIGSQIKNKKYMKAFKNLLTPHFSKITIFCYIRRQDQWLQSALSQQLRVGNIPFYHFNPIRIKCRRVLKYHTIYKRWCKHFDKTNVMFRAFNTTSFHQNDLLADFCYHLSIPYQICKKTIENASLNTTGQLYLFCINILSAKGGFDEAKRSKYVDFINRHYAGKGFGPTTSQLKAIKRYFTPINKFMNNEVLSFAHCTPHPNPLDRKTIRLIKNKYFQQSMFNKLTNIMKKEEQ